MKKNEIVSLNKLFNELKNLGNTKFKYFNIKNISLLKSHIEPLEIIEKENKEVLSDFEKERNELIIKLGEAREDGRVYIDTTNDEVVEEFNNGLKDLILKHKESLDEYEKLMNDFSTVLEEELEEEVNFRTIKIEDCPEEGIGSEQLEFLMGLDLIK